MCNLLRARKRRQVLAVPFPESFRRIVSKNVRHAARLTPSERAELERMIRIFLAEKNIEGCGGLVVDDEMRVTIAAHACILLLNRNVDVYPDVDTVLVYPTAYHAPSATRAGPVVVESNQVRLGESWTRGVVVLAWDHVETSTHHAGRGQNVVLHEFAHQLDAEDGEVDGAPDLGTRARYVEWAQVFGDEYRDLSKKIHDGRPVDIDPYGATSPAEFFAVVTELFFERPRALRKRHPELYDELVSFYRQDPAEAPELTHAAKK